MAKTAGPTRQQIETDIRKKQFAPIYLLMGEESFYIDRIADMILKNALTEELASVAHLKKSLDVEANTCYTDKKAGDKPPQPVVAVFLQCWIISLFRKIINGEVAIIRSQVG